MRLLRKLGHIFDNAVDCLAYLAAALLIYIMLLISVEIVSRYLVGRSILWTVETTEYALLYLTFLGAGWLLRREGHVRMDLVLVRLNPRAQAIVNGITSILGAITCLVIVWYGSLRTLKFFQLDYILPSVLMTPAFIIVAVVPLGSFLLFIQFLRRTHGYLKG